METFLIALVVFFVIFFILMLFTGLLPALKERDSYCHPSSFDDISEKTFFKIQEFDSQKNLVKISFMTKTEEDILVLNSSDYFWYESSPIPRNFLFEGSIIYMEREGGQTFYKVDCLYTPKNQETISRVISIKKGAI